MINTDNKADGKLEQWLADFMAAYRLSLLSLAEALDEAKISHYSSGCGNKSITFEIFPASNHIGELLRMLTLSRTHKPKGSGLKDVPARGGPNPANDFLLYVRRWIGFAEQVMQREGDSDRGIAAARAKLIMEEMYTALSEGKPAQTRTTEFARLMETIGMHLLENAQQEQARKQASTRQAKDNNYRKALAVAQGDAALFSPRPQVA